MVGNCKEILEPRGSYNRTRGNEMGKESEIALGMRPTVQLRTCTAGEEYGTQDASLREKAGKFPKRLFQWPQYHPIRT